MMLLEAGNSALVNALQSCALISGVSFVGALLIPLLDYFQSARRLTEACCLTLAASVMCADALMHLVPHAFEAAKTHEEQTNVGIAAFLGALALVVFEQLCHGALPDSKIKPHGLANLLVEMVHNFIDGIAISVSWATSPAAGLATTWAVAAHEIPQELGDFVVLCHAGLGRKAVLFSNFLVSLTCFAGVAFGAYLERRPLAHSYLLAGTAGSFLAVSLNMITPQVVETIHGAETRAQRAMLAFTCLAVCGVSVLAMLHVGEMEADAHGHHHEHHDHLDDHDDGHHHEEHHHHDEH